MTVKENAMLIFTDAKENNNKFYELILNSDDSIETRWGRVGADGQRKTVYGGKYEFDRILRSKTSKGYVLSKTVGINITSGGQDKMALAETAKRDLVKSSVSTDKNASVLIKLVERLAEMNRHQIMTASNGNIKIDETGLITTPLGLVTSSTISEARVFLDRIEKFCNKKSFSSNEYINALEEYLRLIPQKVPSRRGWYENFFTDFSSLTAQNSLLDQLEGSLDIYKSKEDEIRKKMSQTGAVQEKVFETQLEIVTDVNIINKINKFYLDNKNDRHVSSHLKLKNVFELRNDQLKSRFDDVAKKIGNVKMLWHGTRAFNVLSILKGGLIIPKSGGSYQITGRMFGNGVYLSDQSTKSLNYSYGYWDGGSKDDNCFMFIADTAMGKEYVPAGPSQDLPKPGYDSVFAKAHKSGVMNNEMIVYNINQVHLRYLCEFGR
jgi:poly [ADP-ribose] polymerase